MLMCDFRKLRIMRVFLISFKQLKCMTKKLCVNGKQMFLLGLDLYNFVPLKWI